jgi:branched-chain amino acid aminotransferase
MHSDPAVSPPFLIHNGVLRDAGEDVISLNDGAPARGQGAFETIAAYFGRPFLVSAHLERLRRAAKVLELPFPDEDEIGIAIAALVQANQLASLAKSRIRLTLTSPADGSLSWFIEAGAARASPTRARVVTIPHVRNERSAVAGLKTINYGENVVAMRLAREAGADEALFGNTRDELCEGTWSNVFLYRDGAFLTPPLSSGCLPGVTRALVLELGRSLGLEMHEVDLPLTDLAGVESAFLTSSLRELQTISHLDGRALSEPAALSPLREAFAAFVARETAVPAT